MSMRLDRLSAEPASLAVRRRPTAPEATLGGDAWPELFELTDCPSPEALDATDWLKKKRRSEGRGMNAFLRVTFHSPATCEKSGVTPSTPILRPTPLPPSSTPNDERASAVHTQVNASCSDSSSSGLCFRLPRLSGA